MYFLKNGNHSYWSFPYTNLGALFRKSMFLDFLNRTPGLYTENSTSFREQRKVKLNSFVCLFVCFERGEVVIVL